MILKNMSLKEHKYSSPSRSLLSLPNASYDPMIAAMDLETLARLRSTSKGAHNLVNPTLTRIQNDKVEMYNTLLRWFPDIKDLPTPESLQDSSLYHRLINSYFSPNPDRVLFPVEVSFKLEILRQNHMHTLDNDVLLENIIPEMRSARGRKNLLHAIEEWRAVAYRNPLEIARNNHLAFLDRIENLVRNDFAVRFGGISSEHQWRAV
jgi:hypothetical protein